MQLDRDKINNNRAHEVARALLQDTSDLVLPTLR